MRAKLQKFQIFLNSHRGQKEQITTDGLWGSETRTATIETFRNTDAPAVTLSDIQSLADNAGIESAKIRAVAAVESGGSGWDRSGLLACLYERHYLFRRISKYIPILSQSRGGGYTIDADGDGINDSWEKLADACRYADPYTVFECASFGKFQIMGAHAVALGYTDAVQFVWSLSRDEAAHYGAFLGFIRANRLMTALNAVSEDPETCRAIAKGYNGRLYYKHNYHGRIAAKYKALKNAR